MYTVYAVYNRSCGRVYIGQTKDLEERLKTHNNRTFKTSYTSRLDGEWILIYSEVVPDRKKALDREKQLKSHRGRESIKKYIPV